MNPTNRIPTCVICGDAIDESVGETPVYCDNDVGDYDGDAYHLSKCEDEVFDKVYAEVGGDE